MSLALPRPMRAAPVVMLAVWATLAGWLAIDQPTRAQGGDEAGAARRAELTGTVEAGLADYRFTITVRNADEGKPLRRVAVVLRSKPRYLANVRIEPARIVEVAPGASRDVSVRFDVREDAPTGAEETLIFRLSATEGVIDRPEVRVRLAIGAATARERADDTGAASEGRPLPEEVYLLINVAGSGYVPHWDGGSYHLSGNNDEVFVVRRGEDPITALRAYRERLLGDPCERRISGTPGLVGRPTFWNAGPQITVLDAGPFVTYSEARYHQELEDDWQRLSRDGPSFGELKKGAGCG